MKNKMECNKLPSVHISNIPRFEMGDRIGKYVKIREIGAGSYGKAIHVKDLFRGRDYVMKSIDISKLSDNEKKDAVNEVKLLSSIRHPFIICFRESFVDGNYLNIVMEYAEGGDLFHMVNTRKQFKNNFFERQIVRWLAQALLGLSYLHNRKILHRDIKSQNMFISNKGLKIGDFGIAKVLESTGAFAKTTIGTPYYLSPEICQSKPYSWSSDVWALGCVAYEMCTLRVPFDAPNLKVLVEKITQGKFLPIQNSYSECLRKIIMDMLTINSSRRPTVNELLNYPIIMAELVQIKKEALSICKNNSCERSILSNAILTTELINTLQIHTRPGRHSNNSKEKNEAMPCATTKEKEKKHELTRNKDRLKGNANISAHIETPARTPKFTSDSLGNDIPKYKYNSTNSASKKTEVISEVSTETWMSSNSNKNSIGDPETSREEAAKGPYFISKINYKNMLPFSIEALLQ